MFSSLSVNPFITSLQSSFHASRALLTPQYSNRAAGAIGSRADIAGVPDRPTQSITRPNERSQDSTSRTTSQTCCRLTRRPHYSPASPPIIAGRPYSHSRSPLWVSAPPLPDKANCVPAPARAGSTDSASREGRVRVPVRSSFPYLLSKNICRSTLYWSMYIIGPGRGTSSSIDGTPARQWRRRRRGVFQMANRPRRPEKYLTEHKLTVRQNGYSNMKITMTQARRLCRRYFMEKH